MGLKDLSQDRGRELQHCWRGSLDNLPKPIDALQESRSRVMLSRHCSQHSWAATFDTALGPQWDCADWSNSWTLPEVAEPGGLWDPGDLPSLWLLVSSQIPAPDTPEADPHPWGRKNPFHSSPVSHLPAALPCSSPAQTHLHTLWVAALTCVPTPRCSCPAPRQGPGSLHLPLPWMGACSSTSELEVGI